MAAWMVVGVLVGAGSVSAATVLHKEMRYVIESPQRMVETSKLRVRIDTPGDIEDWGVHAIYLDENRKLEDVDAFVYSPQGVRRAVKRKDQDSVEYSGEGVAYGSQHYHVIDFSGLQVGSELEVISRVVEAPYFPSQQALLWSRDDVERLEVSVTSTVSGFRWRLDGPQEGLEVQAQAGGVTVRGQQLGGLDPAPMAAGGGASFPILRWAWGEAETWSDIAGWYRQLLGSLPRDEAAIRSLAAELTEGKETPREQLEALVAYARQKVRYVAVEVGIGGYLPTSPRETLERKWGDCKDKSVLLIDLLRAQGIEAYPALVRLDNAQQVDVDFPSAAQFNHLIVAVPEDAVAITAEDPVSEGYLFIDPTQTRGSASYLHAGVQDQHALVVKQEGGQLVATPRRPKGESFYLAFDMELDAEGNAKGRAGLLLTGSVAAALLDQMENAPPESMGEAALGIFENLLPTARFLDVGWEAIEGDIPTARIALSVEVDGLLGGREGRPSFQLASLRGMPQPRDLDDVGTTLRHRVNFRRTVWDLTLPEGLCLPEPSEKIEENDLGRFLQRIEHPEERTLRVERISEMRWKFVEMDDQDALKELALAEHRAHRRRIRLRCDEGTSGP